MSKYYASKIVALAEEQVGYIEKKSNKDLDSMTGNAGSGNYTKYARDLDAIGFYNGSKNGYPWCDVWFDWLFVESFGRKAAKKLLCQPDRSLGAGCGYSMNYYKEKDRLRKSPRMGDQIFFYTQDKSAIAHTGLVYKTDKHYVYTIEGNTSSASGVVANGGAVEKKKYLRNYSLIAGYGRPAYDKEPYPGELPKLKTGVKYKKRKKATKKWQKFLNWAIDARLEVDGDFGGESKSATKEFQEKVGLTATGTADKKTYAAAREFKR